MKIGLVAGEASGDALGAGLIRALREAVPGAIFEGVAGPEMVAAGCEQWEPAESLAVMGLIEPLRHIPRLLRLRRSVARRWIASKKNCARLASARRTTSVRRSGPGAPGARKK